VWWVVKCRGVEVNVRWGGGVLGGGVMGWVEMVGWWGGGGGGGHSQTPYKCFARSILPLKCSIHINA